MKGGGGPLAIVALGGNALIRQGERGTVGEQLAHIQEATQHLPSLLGQGYRLLLTHGNGPVVGHLLLQNEAAREIVPPMPLDVCDADSEGSIGYLTQQTLVNQLRGSDGARPVASIVTQVLVDPEDPAFAAPSKPVGVFYSREQAAVLGQTKGWVLREDAGRGFRRMVPSPRPLGVVEEEPIRILLEHGVIVIAAGGGGIPVIRLSSGALEGVEAVVDKDHASALLGRILGARLLVILTAVDRVCRRFGTPGETPIDSLGADEAREMLAAGEFLPGSMGPKIEAALDFLSGGGEEVLITAPELLREALAGRAGTRILP